MQLQTLVTESLIFTGSLTVAANFAEVRKEHWVIIWIDNCRASSGRAWAPGRLQQQRKSKASEARGGVNVVSAARYT